MRKLTIIVILFLLTLTLSACGEQNVPTENTIESIEVIYIGEDDLILIDDFDLSMYELVVLYSDNSTKTFLLTEDMISSGDLDKLELEGIHQIDVYFNGVKATFDVELITEILIEESLTVRLTSIFNKGVEAGTIIDQTYEEWLETVKGPQGEHGKEVLFQVADGYIQWQYTGDLEWNNLIELTTLTGAAGADGVDGFNGSSAYELYLENNPDYSGDEQQWLNDLINGNLGALVTFTVTFDSNGGSLVDSQEIEDNDKVLKPSDPIREGYTFNGWYINEDEKWAFAGFIITEDVVLTANWTANIYSVIFDANEGLVSPGYDFYTFESNVTLPVPTSLDDRIFAGWFHNDVPVESGSWGFSEDIVLTALWAEPTYSITLDLNGGTLNGDTVQIVDFGQSFSLPIPENASAPFSGWYLGDVKITNALGQSLSEYTFTENIVLTAKYIIDISTANEFNDMRNDLEANYRLISDIDLSGMDWEPIGNLENPFTGTFDGYGFSVNYISITEPYSYVGLFGYSSGVISNVSLNHVNISVTGDLDQVIWAGSLVGYNTGTVYNIDALNGDIYLKLRSGVDGYLGGIVGYNNSSNAITNISSNLTVTSEFATATGGLIGYLFTNQSFSLSTSSNTGQVQGDDYVGGLIGKLENVSITINDSHNTGETTGTNYVGGFVGYGYSVDLIFNSSSNSGSIIGLNDHIGGFIGNSYRSNIQFNYSNNSGVVSGAQRVGGFLGYEGEVSITHLHHSENTGKISGNQSIGGFIGYSLAGKMTIDNSFNQGDITAIGNYSGGFVGRIRIGYSTSYYLHAESSYNAGSVIGSSYVGGLVGQISGSYAFDTNLTNIYNAGNISGVNYIGGIIGSSDQGITVSYSHNSGNVEGSNFIGGLIGQITDLHLYYSINFGDISSNISTLSVGQIFGDSNYTSVDIEEVYYIGTVNTTDGEVDGLIIGNHIDDITSLNVEFFINTLNWDQSIWDLSNIDIVNKQYPTHILD